MSPIPKPPKALNPVQKAIAALIEETQRKGSATIDGVIVHPADLADLKRLMEDENATRSAVRSSVFGAPVFVSKSAQPTGGPLTEAWKKQVEQMKNTPPSLLQGKQWDGVSWDEQHSMDKSELQQQLEDSLWAVATQHQSVFNREQLYQHVGPGHMEDDWYVKKTNGLEEVFLLCKCRMILVLQRCWYERHTGPEPEDRVRCDEPAFVGEATLRRDARCGQHLGTQRGSAQ
jgi:hypothetical protein